MNNSPFSLKRALCLLVLCFVFSTASVRAGELKAGAAKVDIAAAGGPINDPPYVKALVLDDGKTKAVIITVDAVAIGEIGSIKNSYLPEVREQLKKELGIETTNVLVNASHCHARICPDVAQRTVKAVKLALEKMEPVLVGSGSGSENRVMENRRIKLKNGKTADVRHAYALPPDEEIASIGPVDPEIGLLRLDRKDGTTLAVVYNFAMHPIQGVPSGANTADVTGFASTVIEDNLSEGTIALFLQGCGGDINPVEYKSVSSPRDAEPLGNLLGLSALRALRKIKTNEETTLKTINQRLQLPRRNNAGYIKAMEAQQQKLLASLSGTSLNWETFSPLLTKYKAKENYPSYYSHRYLHDEMIGRDNMKKMDEANRSNMKRYLNNIYTMEKLTRVAANLRLLKKHQAEYDADAKHIVDVEVMGLRVGDFRLVSFPGEVTVPIGLNIKKASPHKKTFVAAYSNGYIYYAPTDEQLKNAGGAQEDSDTQVAPGWQKMFEDKALEILKGL
ncbi:MAG: hypothetical protein QM496_06805 [Verrucomicrobiota bacterium]